MLIFKSVSARVPLYPSQSLIEILSFFFFFFLYFFVLVFFFFFFFVFGFITGFHYVTHNFFPKILPSSCLSLLSARLTGMAVTPAFELLLFFFNHLFTLFM